MLRKYFALAVTAASVLTSFELLTTQSLHAFTLTILHNNDGESKLLPTELPSGEKVGGVAFFTTLINQLKAEATTDAVITLSSGDNFLAGTVFNASLNDEIFYDAIALNAIGYDAIALGNHDFDFGPDILANFISSPAFTTPVPFLSSNLDFSGEPALQNLFNQGRIAKSVILDRSGQKIGIIGVTTPLLWSISTPRNVKASQDVLNAVQTEINQLVAQEINKIILVSHLQAISEELNLIANLSGIDIVIAGGSDALLANPDDLILPGDHPQESYPLITLNKDGEKVALINTPGEYRYVGKLEVEFNEQGQLISFAGGVMRVFSEDGIVTDPTIQEKIIAPVQASINKLAANIIAHTEVALNGERDAIRSQETNLGNLIADAILWTGKQFAAEFGVASPTVALQNGGGIRNNSMIPAGNFSELDTFNILPFVNLVTVVPNVSPAQFKAILENAVSRVELADGRFAQIAGFKFAYDPNGTAQIIDESDRILTPGTRIQSVILEDGTVIVDQGKIVANAPSLSIATTNFLASGGDQYPFGDADFINLGMTYQQALQSYLQQGLQGQIPENQYPLERRDRIFVGTLPPSHTPR